MQKTRQICLRVQENFVTEMDNLVERNEFDSRASIIRRALKEFFDKRKILA